MSNYLNMFFVFALVLAIMSVAILPTAYAGCHPECSEFDGNILLFIKAYSILGFNSKCHFLFKFVLIKHAFQLLYKLMIFLLIF